MIKCITIGVSSQDGSVILLDSTKSVTEQCYKLRSGTYGDSTYSRVEVWSSGGGLEKFRNYTANPNVGFDLALKVDNLSIVYGSTPSFTTTFNGLVASDLPASSLGGVATYTVKNSSNLTVIDVANANVGVYTVSVSWAGLPPYYIHKKKTGTLTITKKPIVITATNQTISEGDSAPTFGASAVGLLSNQTIADLGGTPIYIVKNSDGEEVADVSAAPVGTYSIIVSGYTSDNYSITYVAGTLTIAQDIVTITATDQIISEGDSAPTFGATFSGFEDGDDAGDLTGDLSYIVKNSDGEVVADVSTAPAGTYSIIPTGLISANNRYHLNFVPGTLTIEV
jgi:hypothetical protein